MSRSGYIDDFGDEWQLIRWRGMIASATCGKRGQRMFVELLAALDAMPEKVLIADSLTTDDGDVCALGALAANRGIDVASLDPEEPDQVAAAFDIASCLAREVVYMNDEGGAFDETPQQRHARMRRWVARQIKPTTAATTEASDGY